VDGVGDAVYSVFAFLLGSAFWLEFVFGLDYVEDISECLFGVIVGFGGAVDTIVLLGE